MTAISAFPLAGGWLVHTSAKEVLKKPLTVTPAKAGAQKNRGVWIPAYAGMAAFSEFP
jgi:hypothetical protein